MAALEQDRPSCARLVSDRGEVDGPPPAKLRRQHGPSFPSSPTAGVDASLSKAELGCLLDDAVTAGDPAKVRALWYVGHKDGVRSFLCQQRSSNSRGALLGAFVLTDPDVLWAPPHLQQVAQLPATRIPVAPFVAPFVLAPRQDGVSFFSHCSPRMLRVSGVGWFLFSLCALAVLSGLIRIR